MPQMVLPHPTINKEVIKEHQQELPQLLVEDVIHARLKSGRCIGQPKWHDQKIIVPIMTPESGLVYILLSDPDLMIARSKFNLQKVHCPMKLIKQLINPRNGVPVFNGIIVQIPIINAHPYSIVIFLNQNH